MDSFLERERSKGSVPQKCDNDAQLPSPPPRALISALRASAEKRRFGAQACRATLCTYSKPARSNNDDPGLTVPQIGVVKGSVKSFMEMSIVILLARIWCLE